MSKITLLTGPQIKALTRLSLGPASPSEIGEAMTGGVQQGTNFPIKQQGLGRIGGAMAARLSHKGFAIADFVKRQGFPCYKITASGRSVLANTKAAHAALSEGRS